MRPFLQLAFRNVFRNRRRTLMTLAVTAGGVSGLLLFGGFFAYIFWGFREMTIRNGVGHVQIFNSAFFDREETKVLEHGISGYRALAKSAEGVAHVKSVAPRIEFFGMVSNGQKSSTYMATAVEPAAENRMGFHLNVTSGRDLAQATTANEVLLGAGLAKSLSAKPGTELTLLAVTADGALNGIDVVVVGTISSGIKELDDRTMRLSLPSAQQLLDTDRVTKLVVGLDQTENTDAVRSALVARLPGNKIKTWQELSPMYAQMLMLFGGMYVFIGVIVFFMVVISSANTAMMSIFERTREIGTMLAMGTPPRWVLTLFVTEGIFTGVLASVLGIAAGNLLGIAINRARIPLPPAPGNTAGWILQVRQVPELMAVTGVLVIVTLALASLLPAIRASRVNIVESLAHV